MKVVAAAAVFEGVFCSRERMKLNAWVLFLFSSSFSSGCTVLFDRTNEVVFRKKKGSVCSVTIHFWSERGGVQCERGEKRSFSPTSSCCLRRVPKSIILLLLHGVTVGRRLRRADRMHATLEPERVLKRQEEAQGSF